MADRNLNDVQALGKARVVLTGSFRPNGTGAVDNTLNTGFGFTVARTGVGTFTITLADKWPVLQSAQFQLQLATAVSGDVCMGAVDVASAGTIAITYLADNDAAPSAAGDIASNASNRIFFTLVFQNSAAGS